jgi:uncharacterized cupin superfamily protein
MSKKIDIASIKPVIGTLYPPPLDEPCLSRERTKLGDAAGLTQFGVNLLRLPPGAWSSQRHWQTASDEFVYVLSGEVTLVTDTGSEVLGAGDAAGFRAGDPDGHCLQNRTDDDALYWRSARAFLKMRPTTLMSTCSHRLVVSPPRIHIGMAHRTPI